MIHQVVVMGRAVPKGSMIGHLRGRHVIVREDVDERLAVWRGLVTAELTDHMLGQPPMTGPVAVRLDFVMPLRKTDRPVPGVTIWHHVSPDKDKLTRTILDCMTVAEVWGDDGQAAYILTTATRGPDPHVLIEWTSL